MPHEQRIDAPGQGSLGGVLPPPGERKGNGSSKGGSVAAGQPAVEDPLRGEYAPADRPASAVHHFRGSLARDDDPAETRTIDRRAFVGLGISALAAAAVLGIPGMASAGPIRPKHPLNPCHYKTPWLLQPFARTDVDGCSPDDVGTAPTPCAACAACHLHAANKIFISKAAADAERAHIGCRCTIVQGKPMLVSTWNVLFLQGLRRRTSADRRWGWVQRALLRDINYR